MLSEQQQRIMGYFIEEAKDHLNTIEQGLLNLQATIADPEMVHELFRAAHSVKGGAAMLGLTSIQNTAHRLEDYFKVLKDCPVSIDQKLESLLLRVYDTLQELLEQLQGPFGLTDDKAEEAMAAVEPVFTELNQHLGQLVGQAGGKAPEDVDLAVTASSASQPAAVPLSQVTSEASALRFIFQNDVPARLREMLQLFKQADTPASRQQMQNLCQELAQSGEQLDLSGWCDLMTTAQRAIGNMDHSYKVLAPLVIKDIKRAQEQILAGNTNVTASEELIALLPEEATFVEAALETETDFTDLFGASETDDLGGVDAGALDMHEAMTLPELFFEDELPQETSALNLDFGELGFDATDADVGFNALEFDLPVADEERGSGLLNKTGPEVGMAELNSLADLFEGEEPDLELTWQEEVIAAQEQPSASTVEAEGDFSDLFFPDQSEELLIEETEDLSGLLDGTQDPIDSGAIDFSLDHGDENPGAEDLFLDLADLESLDADGTAEDPFAMFAAVVESVEPEVDPVSTDQASDNSLGLGFDDLFTGLDDSKPSDSGLSDSGLSDSGLSDSGLSDSGLSDSGLDVGSEAMENNIGNIDRDEDFVGDLFRAEIDSEAALAELDLDAELSRSAEFDLSEEFDLSDLNLDAEDTPTSDLAIDEFDLFDEEAPTEASDLTSDLNFAGFAGLDASNDLDTGDLNGMADLGFDAFTFDDVEQETSDFSASSLDDLAVPEGAEAFEAADLNLQGALEEGAVDGTLDFSNTIDISELEQWEDPAGESVNESMLQEEVGSDSLLPQVLLDPWSEAAEGNPLGDEALELNQQVTEETGELFSLEPLIPEDAADDLSWQDGDSGMQPGDAFDRQNPEIEGFNLEDFSLDVTDLGEEEILDSSELIAFHLDDPELGGDDLESGLAGFETLAEDAGSADLNFEAFTDEATSSEDLPLDLPEGTGIDAWSAIDPIGDGNDQPPTSDLDLSWLADDELAIAEMVGAAEGAAHPVNLDEAFDADLAAHAEAIPAESIDLAEFELSDDLVGANEEDVLSEDGVNWLTAETSEFSEAEQSNLDFEDVALDSAIDPDLFETVVEAEADDSDLALTETAEDLFGNTSESMDGFMASPMDGFDWDANFEAGEAIDQPDWDASLEAGNSIDQFDLALGAETAESSFDGLDLDLEADQADNLESEFDLDLEAIESTDNFDLTNEAALDLPSDEFDLTNGFDLDLEVESEGTADGFDLDFVAQTKEEPTDDNFGFDFGDTEVGETESSQDLMQGFELNFGETESPQDLMQGFELDETESPGEAEETSDWNLDFGTEGEADPMPELFFEEAGDLETDFDLFAEVDAASLASNEDAASNMDLGLAGLGLAAGSALFAANAGMDDANNESDLSDASAELDDADFGFAESDDREDEALGVLDLGLANLEPEAVELESTELTMPIVLESELEDLDGFADLESTDFSIDADPQPFDFTGEDWDQTLTESSELDDLDALLSEENGVEPVAFDDLEAVLAEDSFPVTAIHEDPPAEIAAEFNDFADLDALLEEPLPATAPAEKIDVSLVPTTAKAETEDEFSDLEALLQDADQTLGIGASPARKSPAAANRRPNRRSGLSEQTMRVSVKHLDNLNNLVGEMVVNRNSLEQAEERLRQFLDNLLYQVQQLSDVGQRMRDLYERSLLESSLLSSRRGQPVFTTISGFHSSGQSHATGASFDALEMDRFTGFHTLSQEMIELIVRVRESASDIDFVVEETDQVTRNFRQITTQLQEGLTRSRMVPFSQTADRLPRGVRDNSLKYGKQAELVIEGRDTLIDKMIVELLYDPMTHLVNNAIAHGIETPEQRIASGKSPTGRITIRAFHQGNQTVIAVSDDGAGIKPETVRAKALAKGLITPTQARDMSRLDTYDLLFHHGFSTVDQADDLCGRGVGLDVVRNNLNEIRGTINIDSVIGKGTTFTIRLPLTLSISKALCCISNRARVAFPMDGVEDMLDVPRERVQTDEQGRSCIQWRDILLPFQPLAELLRYNRVLGRGSVYGGNQEDDMISIVVLRSAGNFLALQVDQVLGEQEIVIKQLEGPVPKPIGVAGATVLGDGRIMPIADVLELIDLWQGRIRREPGALLWDKGDQLPPEPMAASEPTVLIVDDSITVRELLSMTFSKVGYRVEQARDGQEAWEKLRSGLPCDLVFCDIEMPRMDGLELLSRIQKDPHLNHLPIAMLTSRGADRHRQMAVQLGAKGYFTKPYLEEMLLDAAQRMLKGEVMVVG